MFVCVCMCACMFVCVWVCVCLSIELSVFLSFCLSVCVSVNVCLYAFMSLCMHVCVCLSVPTCVCAYAHACTCTYGHMILDSSSKRPMHRFRQPRRRLYPLVDASTFRHSLYPPTDPSTLPLTSYRHTCVFPGKTDISITSLPSCTCDPATACTSFTVPCLSSSISTSSTCYL